MPLADIKPKTAKVVASEMVTSINGNEAKVPFGGRPFTCCIHSDLPHALETMRSTREAVDETVKAA